MNKHFGFTAFSKYMFIVNTSLRTPVVFLVALQIPHFIFQKCHLSILYCDINFIQYLKYVLIFVSFTVPNTDENECEEKTANCDQHATCTNNPGSYKCNCNVGYSGDGENCEGAYICSPLT